MQNTPLTLLMAQINPTVGAIAGNTEIILDIIRAHQDTHDVIVFPETAITGYPVEDLLFRDGFFEQVDAARARIARATKACHVMVGHPTKIGETRYNSVSIYHQTTLCAIYHKHHLPNVGVFDECRYFTPGTTSTTLTIKGTRIGLCICEDLWQSGPVEHLIAEGIDVLISLNASPFDYTKQLQRETLLQKHAAHGVHIVYVNLVGGQDELIFDGQSTAFDKTGQLAARAPAYVTALQTITISEDAIKGDITPMLDKTAGIYQALVCGLRDYVDKNKFPGVLLGLSGGIDSALVACLAVDALGPSRVHAVMMPSRYSAAMSLEDARKQADTLGIEYTELSIEPSFTTILDTLNAKILSTGTTQENLQARIRGILLMALSNQTGMMLLTTSNKSEAAVGYATLYGDLCGGFAPLKDVLKTTVYALVHYRNGISPVIPNRVITRPPSAELAPNQTDQDTLPDYETLDKIISHYMEDGLNAEKISQLGYAYNTVSDIIQKITRNEYKRRQTAPGTKISPVAFGRDWRYPITSGF